MSISSIDRYIQRQCIANVTLIRQFNHLKSLISFAPHGNRFHRVVEYLESDARSSERGLGKKSLMNKLSKRCEKDEEDDARRGGQWKGQRKMA